VTTLKDLRVETVDIHRRRVVDRLLQLYLYEFTAFTRWDVNDEGLYDYPWIERYWTQPGRSVWLFRVGGHPAGFALVGTYSLVLPAGSARSMSEFFVMRKYRRMGVGRAAATAIFDRLPGAWEVAQWRGDLEATAFWRKVIGAYTGGRFDEHAPREPEWAGFVQTFDNGGA